ncbi:lipopolysaccharide biosynthesis protein [Pseudoxanthomonas sp. JBR18]|uniref:lipopolysaccharide biosynthesis protein n=1 Tax=Pseudoxanthomonas sp. JBR18 TaxID=2969308 RepID=UPI00230677AB|nr:lipopolysaccharide biosynthesis protein [Pseudoxanthomonas sp. JBR18]WCE06453.1 lipopolysaccharide biosynthesis protein [Pseudoxanthomonas sp. JBR18]
MSATAQDGPPGSTSGLGSRAAAGAAKTMLGQGARMVVQFGGIILLARLLSPEDYGLMAMVTALVGICEILRDFGLSSAAIQAKSLSKEQRDNLFWLNSGIGLILGLTVFAGAGAISRFYHEPRLIAVAQVMSVTFLLSGMNTQYRAHLSRGLQFGRLAMSDVGGQSLGLIAGVCAALYGLGYWALVIQQVVGAFIGLLVSAIASRWLPGRPHRGVPMRSFLTFGGHLMAAQMLGYVSQNIGQVVIGYRIGAEALGLYNRAFQLLMMPLNQINAPATTVALPVLSKLQDEPSRYAAFLLRGQTVMIHVIVAIFSFACAQASPLIILFLGQKWQPAVPIFQILTLGGIFQVVAYAAYWVFLSLGLTREQLTYSVLVRVLTICCIFAGVHWGALGVAVGYSTGLALTWPISVIWVTRAGKAPGMAMFNNGLRAIIGYGVCAVASWSASHHFANTPVMELVVGLPTIMLAFGVVCLVWPAFRRDVMTILNSRDLLRRRK